MFKELDDAKNEVKYYSLLILRLEDSLLRGYFGEEEGYRIEKRILYYKRKLKKFKNKVMFLMG